MKTMARNESETLVPRLPVCFNKPTTSRKNDTAIHRALETKTKQINSDWSWWLHPGYSGHQMKSARSSPTHERLIMRRSAGCQITERQPTNLSSRGNPLPAFLCQPELRSHRDLFISPKRVFLPLPVRMSTTSNFHYQASSSAMSGGEIEIGDCQPAPIPRLSGIESEAPARHADWDNICRL